MYDGLIWKIKDLIPEVRSNSQYYTAKVLAEAANTIEKLASRCDRQDKEIDCLMKLIIDKDNAIDVLQSSLDTYRSITEGMQKNQPPKEDE